MSRRPSRTTTAAAVAILSSLLTAPASSATTVDRTPPTAPFVGYAQGFQCLMVIIGANRSTDDVTPQPEIRYEAYADGVPIGMLSDLGQESGAWGVLHVTKPGPNTITVRAIDAAGNRSGVRNAPVVTGYYTPGCAPGRIG